MKYLTATSAIACMAFAICIGITTQAQANSSAPEEDDFEGCVYENENRVIIRSTEERCRIGTDGTRPIFVEVNDVEPLEQFAYGGDDQFECSALKLDQNGAKLCVVADENGSERVAGIEVPDGVLLAGQGPQPVNPEGDWIGADICRIHTDAPFCPSKAEGERTARGEQPSASPPSSGNNDSVRGRAVKTASGTFYPLPMMTVAEMNKLLAPGGMSVASFDKILAPGGTAVESDYQFADREDGSGRDFGDSGGGDFGESDRAAASTAAE